MKKYSMVIILVIFTLRFLTNAISSPDETNKIYSVDELVRSNVQEGTKVFVSGRYNGKLISAGSDYEGPGGGSYLFGETKSIHITPPLENVELNEIITVKGDVTCCGGKKINRYICGLTNAKIISKSEKTKIQMPIDIDNSKVPVEIREAAEKRLNQVIEEMPDEVLEDFNFSSREQLNRAILGVPFRVYTITRKNILAYDCNKTKILDIISPTYYWRFPVISDGESRDLLTVDFFNGVWKGTSFGASGLAKRWESIIKNWPPSKGYEHIFLRIYQANSDFVILKHERKIEMLPLMPWFGSNKNKTYDPSYIMLKLQEMIKNLTIRSSRQKPTVSAAELKR